MTVKVRYVGPADQVSLAPAAGGTTFRYGEVVEVDDETARSLLAQGTFVKAAPAVPKSQASAARAQPGVESR